MYGQGGFQCSSQLQQGALGLPASASPPRKFASFSPITLPASGGWSGASIVVQTALLHQLQPCAAPSLVRGGAASAPCRSQLQYWGSGHWVSAVEPCGPPEKAHGPPGTADLQLRTTVLDHCLSEFQEDYP